MFNRPSKFKFNKQEENLEMTQIAELQSQLQALTGQLEGVNAELNGSKEALTLAQSVLDEKSTALSDALSKITKLETEKVEAKAATRKQALSAVLAADQVETTAVALSSLDDKSFETVLSTYKSQSKLTKESDLMQELGGTGDEVIQKKPEAGENSHTMKFLKERLGIKE